MKPRSKKHSYFYRNGLTIVFLTLFIATLAAQALTGWKKHNQDLKEDHAAEIGLTTYLQNREIADPLKNHNKIP